MKLLSKENQSKEQAKAVEEDLFTIVKGFVDYFEAIDKETYNKTKGQEGEK